MYKLKLYVTGRTPTADRLIDRLRGMLDQEFDGSYELEVLDVFEFPETAYEDMILATPTLMRVLPMPVKRIVGDLSDKERILAGLELKEE